MIVKRVTVELEDFPIKSNIRNGNFIVMLNGEPFVLWDVLHGLFFMDSGSPDNILEGQNRKS